LAEFLDLPGLLGAQPPDRCTHLIGRLGDRKPVRGAVRARHQARPYQMEAIEAVLTTF
jgi:hypothetical protein